MPYSARQVPTRQLVTRGRPCSWCTGAQIIDFASLVFRVMGNLNLIYTSSAEYSFDME
jgi:hypothetical protein